MIPGEGLLPAHRNIIAMVLWTRNEGQAQVWAAFWGMIRIKPTRTHVQPSVFSRKIEIVRLG
jgi:hypothetical protein